MTKYRTSVALACAVTMALLAPSTRAQGSGKIRDAVENIGISNKMTVVFKNGGENYGAVSDIGTDTFQIVEIDQKQKLIIRYDEVRKI
ncbi:MAG: hypothetical protein ABI882_17345, partial [Acidobacteriota bacterium]